MEGDSYADSSFLVSLLRIDDNHEAAMRYMAKSSETLAFNPPFSLSIAGDAGLPKLPV